MPQWQEAVGQFVRPLLNPIMLDYGLLLEPPLLLLLLPAGAAPGVVLTPDWLPAP